MILPVVRDKSGKSGIHLLPVDEILYFESFEKDILVHTDGDVYYMFRDMTMLSNALQTSEERFYRTDRSFIANLSKVTKLDTEKWNKAHFGKKYCNISKPNVKEVEKRYSDLKGRK